MSTKITGAGELLGVTSINDGPIGGLRNIIINGGVNTSREINQRGITYAAAANNTYWADRWEKRSGNVMRQQVEEDNYVPNSVYTLSGNGITAQQITSPSSGTWNIDDIPSTASNIQVEIGEIATDFEYRSIGLEQLLCFRYYQVSTAGQEAYNGDGGNVTFYTQYYYFTQMRAVPTIVRTVSSSTNVVGGSVTVKNISPKACILQATIAATGSFQVTSTITLDSEI